MPEPLPPCAHPGCDKPGSHGINDFLNPGPTTPKPSYWCADHVPRSGDAAGAQAKRAPRQSTPQGSLL